MGEEKIQKDFKKLIEDILKGRKIDSRNDELNKGLEQLKKRTDQIIKDRNTLDYRDNKSIKTIWSDLHFYTSEKINELAEKITNIWINKENQEMDRRKGIVNKIILLLIAQVLVINIIYVLMGIKLLKYSEQTFEIFVRLTLIEIVGLCASIIAYFFKERSTKILNVANDLFKLIYTNNEKIMNNEVNKVSKSNINSEMSQSYKLDTEEALEKTLIRNKKTEYEKD